MNLKVFAQRLNQGLDAIDVPTHHDERIEALAKLLKIPRFKSECLLSGACAPDSMLLAQLTEELELSSEWLLGESE